VVPELRARKQRNRKSGSESYLLHCHKTHGEYLPRRAVKGLRVVQKLFLSPPMLVVHMQANRPELPPTRC
jgi:hypothetical protein